MFKISSHVPENNRQNEFRNNDMKDEVIVGGPEKPAPNQVRTRNPDVSST